MSNFSLSYDYKKKEKKDKDREIFISIRNRNENSLLEIKKNGNLVEFFTYWRNEKTTKFVLPLELFEKIYKDIM